MNDEFDIMSKKDLEDINKLNDKYKQKSEPSNGSGLFELFGQEDVKKESIVQKLESNNWTKFSNEKLVHLINLKEDQYKPTKIPVEHNNAIFRDFIEMVKKKERSFLNGMQTETLLQLFGRKILYGHLKDATILDTLKLCQHSFAIFRTADQSPGISIEFLDIINVARSKKNLLIRTVPQELAINTNVAEALHIESSKLILMDYLFAFDYIFHKDSRYLEERTVINFDAYYKPFITELENRIKNKDNVIWLVNKFPNMLLNTIAWDDQCDKCKGKFEGFSLDDMPNIKVMKSTLHDVAILIKENINSGLNISALPNGPYLLTVLKKYDNRYNSPLFEDL